MCERGSGASRDFVLHPTGRSSEGVQLQGHVLGCRSSLEIISKVDRQVPLWIAPLDRNNSITTLSLGITRNLGRDVLT